MVSGNFVVIFRISIPSPKYAGFSEIPNMGCKRDFKIGEGIGYDPAT